MEYIIDKASNNDIELLIKYEKDIIYKYANDLTKKEIEEIEEYVKKEVLDNINNYFTININKQIIGCLLITNYEDGKEIAELYLEEEYRNKGIGTKIINNIIKENDILYLWVYKLNKKAISLYKRLGFKTIDETSTRYLMKYNR